MEPYARKFLFISILITSFVSPFMGSSVNLALPQISHEFKLNALIMSWVGMSYLLASAATMIPLGKWADVQGRKQIFVLGSGLFGVSSLLCAFSPTTTILLGARIIQGIAAAMIFATNMAILTEIYPAQQRGRAIGLNVTSVYLGLSLAPVISGFMIKALGWRSIFIFSAIPMLLVSIFTHLWVKHEWKEKSLSKFDTRGSVIFIVSISLLMYGFSELPEALPTILTIMGLLGLGIFIRYCQHNTNSVFEVHLFTTNRLFAFANLAALINYATTFAITFILSLFFQYGKGFSPSKTGLILLIQPGIMATIAWFSGRLSDKYDPRWLASTGMLIIIIGLGLLIPVNLSTPLTYIVIVLGIIGLGFGIFTSPNTNSIMGSVDKKLLGLASATAGSMRLIGQMLSMGIATMILHVFFGKVALGENNVPQLVNAQQIIFAVFIALGVIGLYASLVRPKKQFC